MRLVTWNVFRADCLEKAALLDHLDADVIVLQECARQFQLSSTSRATPPLTVEAIPLATFSDPPPTEE